MKIRSIATMVFLAVTLSSVAEARDQIRIVGSSTVFPFSTAVAERFGRATKFKTPVVESTGSGGGMKLFCAGVGPQHPDITNCSRRIKQSELDDCTKNGVTLSEVKIGYDGIVLANAKAAARIELTIEQLFLALAKDLPKDGKLVANWYEKWNEIDASLPAVEIEVIGPPPTSGTRDAFAELVLEKACPKIEGAAALGLTEKACHAIREDGKYVEAGENDNLIVQKLQANAAALGVFGYSFLDQNRDKVQGSIIGGVEPSYENIADGKYPVSRPLYFYVKKQHVGVVPGIEEYVAEFGSESAIGPEGYLADKGLIPMPETERAEMTKQAATLAELTL